MCGRYVTPNDAAIEREFNIVRAEWKFPPNFNVAPTQTVPVIRSVDGTLQGVSMRWGLIPFFAKGEPPKYSTINARIETVETAASYRGPWKRGQRCLQVARVLRVAYGRDGSQGAILHSPQRPGCVRFCGSMGSVDEGGWHGG